MDHTLYLSALGACWDLILIIDLEAKKGGRGWALRRISFLHDKHLRGSHYSFVRHCRVNIPLNGNRKEASAGDGNTSSNGKKIHQNLEA